MRYVIAVLILLLVVVSLMFAQVVINSGQFFPTNGPLTPQPNAVGIGSDSGVLTGYDAKGNKFVLGASTLAGSTLTLNVTCPKGTGNIGAGWNTSSCKAVVVSVTH